MALPQEVVLLSLAATAAPEEMLNWQQVGVMRPVAEPSCSLPAIRIQLLGGVSRWTLGRERRAAACEFLRAPARRSLVGT